MQVTTMTSFFFWAGLHSRQHFAKSATVGFSLLIAHGKRTELTSPALTKHLQGSGVVLIRFAHQPRIQLLYASGSQA